MASAEHIIKTLGGAATIARATGFPLTTIASWSAANFVPEWRRSALIKLAKDTGVKLTGKDFPSTEQRVSRPNRPAEQTANAA